MTTEEKICEVINRMLADPGSVKDILQSDNEYYFSFQGHVFSVQKRVPSDELGNYVFYVYPKWVSSTESLHEEFETTGGFGISFASFGDIALGENSKNLLENLHGMLQRKVTGVDDVLDDILSKTLF